MEKKKIAVIFGGKSSEHEISRISASYVISQISREKYDIFTIGITKQGKWLLYSGDIEAIKDGSWENDVNNKALAEEDAHIKKLKCLMKESIWKKNTKNRLY